MHFYDCRMKDAFMKGSSLKMIGLQRCSGFVSVQSLKCKNRKLFEFQNDVGDGI